MKHRYFGSIALASTCSRDGCSARPIALAPWGTSQIIFLCEEHADQINEAIADDRNSPLTGVIKWIVPTCQALVNSTTPCGGASTRVSIFVTADGWATSCMCDRHTSLASQHPSGTDLLDRPPGT